MGANRGRARRQRSERFAGAGEERSAVVAIRILSRSGVDPRSPRQYRPPLEFQRESDRRLAWSLQHRRKSCPQSSITFNSLIHQGEAGVLLRPIDQASRFGPVRPGCAYQADTVACGFDERATAHLCDSAAAPCEQIDEVHIDLTCIRGVSGQYSLIRPDQPMDASKHIVYKAGLSD